jgi:hypothetical protein
MFIIGTHVVCSTNRKVIIGIGFLTLATFLLGFSLLFYLNYLDMAQKISLGGLSGCDHCPLAMEYWLNSSRTYGIVGAIVGGIGAWLTIAGLKFESIEALKQ